MFLGLPAHLKFIAFLKISCCHIDFDQNVHDLNQLQKPLATNGQFIGNKNKPGSRMTYHSKYNSVNKRESMCILIRCN